MTAYVCFQLLAGLAAIGFYFLGKKKSEVELRESMRFFAGTFGLEFESIADGGLERGPFGGVKSAYAISGSYLGYPVRITTARSSRRAQGLHYHLEIPDLQLGLSASARSLAQYKATPITTLINAPVDDLIFGEEVSSGPGTSPELRAYLTHRRRFAITSLLLAWRDALITDTEISLTRRGIPADSQPIRQMLDELVRVASELAHSVAPVPEQIPEDVPAAPLEVEPIAQEAVRVAVAPETPPKARPVSAVAYTSLRAELFESGLMGSGIKSLFQAKFAGREVKWTGSLRRVSAYTTDLIFNGPPGAKAIVELEGIPDGSFDKGVQAIVQLPTEATAEFSTRYDIEVEFTGKLHSCDAFLRDIFVEAGCMEAR